MRVILRSPFSQWSGYGRDGIGLAQALMDRGHQVSLAPSDVAVPLPRDIAGLFTEPVVLSDIAIHHIEPHKAQLPSSDASMARLNVLWTMWGWQNLPEPEKAPWVEKLAAETENYDYVLVYDTDSERAFAPYIPPEKTLVLQGGYAANDWGLNPDPAKSRKSPDSPFVFGMVGNLGVRKGVYESFKAFCELREEHGDGFNAQLDLYSTSPVFPPGVILPDGVSHHLGRMLPPQLKQTYWSFDTLLAPSMADAKHLPPIEALACGVPVIASDIVGHRSWATSDMVTWVATEPGQLRHPDAVYDGRSVDVESLKAAMWTHYTDRFRQAQRAASAARMLPAAMDWSKCLERLGLAVGTRL